MKIDFGQIVEKFNQLDIKIRYGIFVGVLLAIVVLDIFTIMGFQWLSLQKIDSENLTLQQNIERLKMELQSINQIKAGLSNSRAQLEAMNVKIRPVADKDAILEDISRLANEEDVKIDQLSPQTESQQVLISTNTVKYYALPVVIQATSGYHTFGHFINRLESAKLFFILTNLEIENHGVDIYHHSINATLKVVLSDKNTDKVTDKSRGGHKK